MNTSKLIGRTAYLSSNVEKLGIREVTIRTATGAGAGGVVEVNEEPGQFHWGVDVFKTRAQAEAILRDMIAAFERQADRLRKCLAAPEMPHSKDYKLLDDAREAMMECRVWIDGAPDAANVMIEDTIRALSKRLDTDYEPPAAAEPNNDPGFSIDDDSLLIAGRTVVSRPGAAIKVTQIDLTPRGKELLRVKKDVHIPGLSRKKTTA